MNQYTTLLYYLKQLAERDNYVNTITKGDNIDLNKTDIYPLFNIEINAGTFPSLGTIEFVVQLQCLNIRDINNEVVIDKFWEQDNEVDNHNNTLATLNRIWVIMKRDFEGKNITSSDNPAFDKLEGEGKNLLDGWEMTFNVEMPNTDISLC